MTALLQYLRQRKLFMAFKYFRFLLYLAQTAARQRVVTPRKLVNLALARLYSIPGVARRIGYRAQKYPAVLILDVTNRCNLRCVFCRDFPNSFLDRKQVMAAQGVGDPHYTQRLGAMDLALVQKVVAELRHHVLVCVLYVSGEPLMHPRIVDIVRCLTENRILSIISTNGHYLTPQLSEGLIRAGLTSLHVSVSGVNQGTHEVYHRGGDIERVKRNLEDFVAVRRAVHGRTWVDLRYIVTRHNEHEIPLAHRWGESAQLNSVTARSGTFFTVESARAFLSERYNTSSLKVVQDRLVCGKNLTTCDWPWGVSIVRFDGELSPCCDAVYSSRPMELGNLKDHTFAELWHGEAYTALRHDLVTIGRRHMDFCRNCFYGGFNFQS